MSSIRVQRLCSWACVCVSVSACLFIRFFPSGKSSARAGNIEVETRVGRLLALHVLNNNNKHSEWKPKDSEWKQKDREVQTEVEGKVRGTRTKTKKQRKERKRKDKKRKGIEIEKESNEKFEKLKQSHSHQRQSACPSRDALSVSVYKSFRHEINMLIP